MLLGINFTLNLEDILIYKFDHHFKKKIKLSFEFWKVSKYMF